MGTAFSPGGGVFAEVGALVAPWTTSFASGNSSDGREGTLALPVTKVTDFTIALELASAATSTTSFGNVVGEITVEATAFGATARQIWKRAFARPVAKVPRGGRIFGYLMLGRITFESRRDTYEALQC